MLAEVSEMLTGLGSMLPSVPVPAMFAKTERSKAAKDGQLLVQARVTPAAGVEQSHGYEQALFYAYVVEGGAERNQ
jgi:hypothetical protein